MAQINVAIIGIGNCAKSLIEGIAFYSNYPNETTGLMHPLIGNYSPADINFVAAFDIDERKVGNKIDEAIYSKPNNTKKIFAPVKYDVVVERGVTLDSVVPELREYFIHESGQEPVNVTQVLQKSKAQIVINYLPTGSDKATYFYARAALEANCSFINCMPTPISKDSEMQKKFSQKGLILMGDDIKSQLGATIINRMLLNLLEMRGVRILKSEQINYGGNADHYNLHFRPHSKEASKEASLYSVIGVNDKKPTAKMVYMEENYDHKQAKIKIEGEIFGRMPVSIDITLDDEDSPNSAGVVIDAIRGAKLLLDECRILDSDLLCSYLMKAPIRQLADSEAHNKFNDIIFANVKKR